MRALVVLTAVLYFSLAGLVRADALDDQVLLPSVRVKTTKGIGSGTIFKHDNREYVVTAGHVIAHAKEVKEVEITKNDGTVEKKQKAFWPQIDVTRTLFREGKEIGELKLMADVIAFSDAEESGGMDIAVLKLVENDILKSTAIWGDSDVLKPGTEILHVGSVYGSITGAFCKGNVMRLDFVLPELNSSRFVVANLGGMRSGSSGGGVFIQRDNHYEFVGMVVRSDSGGLTLLKSSAIIGKFLTDHRLSGLTAPAKKAK